MSTLGTISLAAARMRADGHGKHFLSSDDLHEVFQSLMIVDDVIPSEVPYSRLYGLLLIPTDGGYYLWYACEYCQSREIPTCGYCPTCGGTL
jgi:hypothetical protein